MAALASLTAATAVTAEIKARVVVIVTGLPGAGKTTFAATLASAWDATVVCADTYRYEPHTWIKRPKGDFCHAVCTAVGAAPSRLVIVESTLHDSTDLESARETLLYTLLRANTVFVFILKPTTLHDQVEALIGRSLRRAAGTEAHGAAAETPASVARLVIKAVDSYAANVAALERFAANASIVAGAPCLWLPRVVSDREAAMTSAFGPTWHATAPSAILSART